MAKRKVTFVINEGVVRDLKIAAASHDTNQSEIVERGILLALESLKRGDAHEKGRRCKTRRDSK